MQEVKKRCGPILFLNLKCFDIFQSNLGVNEEILYAKKKGCFITTHLFFIGYIKFMNYD